MTSIQRSLILACLLLGALACNSGGNTPTPTALPPTATVEATATPLPPPTRLPGLAVDFGGMAFIVPKGLATGISGEVVPPMDDPDAPYWARNPAYTEVTLTGYQLEATFHYPRVAFYPVAEYRALYPELDQTIATLQSLIADPTLDLPTLPMLPVWNAAQMLHVQVAPVAFTGGRGVRYLAEYGQDVHPISNQGLFYTFQGLSDDGAYYVVAVLPVSHPTLPADGQLDAEDYDAFSQQFESYLQDLTVALNAETPTSFSPSLPMLDTLVETIALGPPLQ